ncbi:DUF1465 family protein [Sphingomonas sp. ID0503]|uniref:DUF1465 family protein n=1 Tax=Sphingomonas sp. ID0503 TaxID=3399691 RepID=UPI003AFA5188
MNAAIRPDITARLVETLYAEALVLADEMRIAFQPGSAADEVKATPAQRVSLACESLKTTTRLMTVITWLLGQRARLNGEIATVSPLGEVDPQDERVMPLLPGRAQQAVRASVELYDRISRIAISRPVDHRVPVPANDARALFSRLERAF